MTASGNTGQIPFSLRVEQARDAQERIRHDLAAQRAAVVLHDADINRDRANFRNWVNEQKAQRDERLEGTNPELVFGSEAMESVHDFLEHMNRVGWPHAETLFRYQEEPEHSIFGPRPPRPEDAVASIRGYCVGVVGTYRGERPRQFIKAVDDKNIDQPISMFLEKDMVYLCKDGTLRVRPSQFESLPLAAERSWYNSDGHRQLDKILKPVTPAIFGRTQAKRSNPTGGMSEVTVAAFRPHDINDVLFSIAVTPANGRTDPGYIPELHAKPKDYVPPPRHAPHGHSH